MLLLLLMLVSLLLMISNDSMFVAADVEGEKPDVSHIFQVNSQTLTTVCQTNVYMTPAQVTPRVGSDAMDSQVACYDWSIVHRL